MPRDSILGGFLHHFSGQGAKRKKCVWTAQACTDCISGFPGNALFRNFFHPCFRSPAREVILARFWCFWSSLGLHFGGRGCTKMRSEKMMQKVFKNGSAGHAAKTAPGAVGPLKTDKIRQSDHQTLDRTRPGVPGGTVADSIV